MMNMKPTRSMLASAVLVALAMVALLRTLRSARYSPFLLTLGLVFLAYSGLGISLWPNVIPPSVSIWEAAGPNQSLGFTLVGESLREALDPKFRR